MFQITTLHKYILVTGYAVRVHKWRENVTSAYDRRASLLRTGRLAERFFFSVPAPALGTRCFCLFIFNLECVNRFDKHGTRDVNVRLVLTALFCDFYLTNALTSSNKKCLFSLFLTNDQCGSPYIASYCNVMVNMSGLVS